MRPRALLLCLLGLLAVITACRGKSSGSRARATPPPPPAAKDTGPPQPQLVGQPVPKPTIDVISAVRFTRDGRHLLALDRSFNVFAFDHQTGALREAGWFGFEVDRSTPDTSDMAKLEAWLKDHESIEAFDLSADGRFVVGGGGRTGRLAVWELRPGQRPPARLVADIQAPLREIDVVAFARGDTRLVVGGRTPDEDSTSAEDTVFALVAFDGKSLTPLHSLPAGQRLGALVVSPDGELAAVVGSSEFVRLLAIGERELSTAFELEAEDTLVDARFSPDGKQLITAGFDQAVTVWDVARQPPGLKQRHVLRHHQGKVRQVEVAPDGRWLVASSTDREVSFWPLAGLAPDRRVAPILIKPSEEDVTYAMAIHPSWPWLVTSGDALRVWKLNRDALATGGTSTPRKAGPARVLPWTGPPVLLAAFRPSGELLAVDSGGGIALWNLAVDPPVARIVRAGEPMPAEGWGPVKDAALDGDAVLLARDPQLVRVALEGGAEQRLELPAVAIAVAGPCWLVGLAGGRLAMWITDAAGPREAAPLELQADTVRTLALAPGGGLAITSGSTGALTSLRSRPLDPATCAPTDVHTQVFAPPTPFGNVNHTGGSPDGQETPITIAFSPDGRWLLSGGLDGGSATLWAVTPATIEQRAFLAGHQYGVFAVAFSPDGTRALTAGTKGHTLLWRFDPATGAAELLEDLPVAPTPGAGFPESIAWSPDGGQACIAGGHYHTGRIWCYTLAR